MCHTSVLEFGRGHLNREEIEGKDILEIGSYNINGSLRPLIESFGPGSYLGIDLKEGPGVDRVLSAEGMIEKLGRACFDVVISTEVLEHVWDWSLVIKNIKWICKPGGLVLITTRSLGFPVHSCPHDFWRFGVSDMGRIFSDFYLEFLGSDPQVPGVFVKARKPSDFCLNDLSEYEVYSIREQEQRKRGD